MKKNNIYILAIETSCDDTAASVICNTKILSNIISSQTIHELYGGIVPELASREHQKLILPIVDNAIKKAKIKIEDLDAIAYTNGPGLIGSLMVGSSFAKSLSLSLNIPLIEVNHMQAHILAHFIHNEDNEYPKFPFLSLTVSGGHTQIVQVNDYFDMKEIGSTLDDAVGEAFDKSGKVMGLNYPAGPEIDKLSKLGDPYKFKFTKPNVADLNFSFSGIKTGFMNFINNNVTKNKDFIKNNINDICASLQFTIVEILTEKLIKAAKITNINNIVICGGVSANSELRKKIINCGNNYNWNVFIPNINYTTDNAAMIAITAYFKYNKSDFANLNSKSIARLKF